MSDSTYASLDPVYHPADAAPYRSAAVIPAADQPKAKPVNPQSDVFRNTIYDNVDIDVSAPEKEDAEFCQLEEDEPTAENGDAEEKTGDGYSITVPQNAVDFVKGITKKQWLWAGGITAGILMLRKRKK